MKPGFILLILPFFAALPVSTTYPQTRGRATISGTIRDSESGKPLSDALIYLSNTPAGTSSADSGRFTLAHIPPGSFEMVVSHVGFRKKTFSVHITEAESLLYQISMEAEPVQIREVEVLGTATRKPDLAASEGYSFFPRESPNTYCLYINGPSRPIGVFFSDSGFYMYSLDTAIVDSEKYLRMWLLYKNLSQTPYRLDPMKCARLQVQGNRRLYHDILPDWPAKLLASIDTQRAIDEVAESAGKALRALAVVQTKAADVEEYFIRWGGMTGPFHYTHGTLGPSTQGSLSADLYSMFSGGANVGILGKYTVYPENSVNGFIYFPFPGLGWKAATSGFSEAAEFVYTVELITQTGSKFIQFVPH
jgi:hypothetical protein